jgi:hypothetical protein
MGYIVGSFRSIFNGKVRFLQTDPNDRGVSSGIFTHILVLFEEIESQGSLGLFSLKAQTQPQLV